jgi:alpha-N-acetylglucosamine transferase
MNNIFVVVIVIIAFLVGIFVGTMFVGAPIAREELRDSMPQFAAMTQLNAVAHVPKFAVVTLATQRAYLIPAYALATSLRATRSVWPLIALVSNALSRDADVVRNLTLAGFTFMHVVDTIDSPARVLDAPTVKKETGRAIQPHKMEVFTKFRVFQMIAFDRVLFLDADTVVLSNIDHLLHQHEPYGVVPSLVHDRECDVADEYNKQFAFMYAADSQQAVICEFAGIMGEGCVRVTHCSPITVCAGCVTRTRASLCCNRQCRHSMI